MDYRACAKPVSNETEVCSFCQTELATWRDGTSSPNSRGSRIAKSGSGRTTSGGPTTILVVLGVFLLFWKVLPAGLSLLTERKPVARRTQCKDKLKQLGLALHLYHDSYGSFPPAVTYSANGRPMHSWRVLILPFLGSTPLSEQYMKYNLNEPWNSTGNRAATASMPEIFLCRAGPHGLSAGQTSYLALDGPGAVMNSRHPAQLKEVVDGPSRTFLVIEALDSGIGWSEPGDFDISQTSEPGPGGLSSAHSAGFHALFADSSIRFIPKTISPQTLQALLTRDGGEEIGDY
jgi:hypothetical protein